LQCGRGRLGERKIERERGERRRKEGDVFFREALLKGKDKYS